MSFVQAGASLTLFAMMLVVGLELTVADFRRVLTAPRAVIVGTLGQLFVLPLASAGLLAALDPEPHLAVGLLLIVAAPGGGISNVFAYLAGAHTALSVTLTALASLLAVVTLPLLMALGVRWIGGGDLAIQVPAMVMIGQLGLLVLLPICLGMTLRTRRPALRERFARPLRRSVLVGVVVIVALGFGTDQSGLTADLPAALGVALAWTLLAMGLGWGLGRLAGLDRRDVLTLLIELSVKNAGLAALVALASLGRPELAVFVGAYVVVGYPLVVGVAALSRRRAPGSEAG